MEINVLESILNANSQVANDNRRLLKRYGVFCINLLASPGAGKTSFIVRLIRRFKGRLRIGVVEGDLASDVDTQTVAREGGPVLQINTGGGCHLNAPQLADAFARLPLEKIDLLIIENVGNLVCTAGYDLGENLRLVLASVPEGDDKPYKYPKMFHIADTIVVNKIDLMPYIEYDYENFVKAVRGINSETALFPVSCKTDEGFDAVDDWLVERLSE
jgi:hydrogenase nickel incorporation protein HypB